MSDKTGIEWTDATWNPIAAFRRDNGKRGWHCEKVSEGCRGCYAERLNGRKLQAGTGLPYTRASRDLVEIRAVNLDAPLRWREPRRIFVESMSDLFAEFVPDELIDQVFATMALAPRHTFQILTKRPERMRRWSQRIEEENGEGFRDAMIEGEAQKLYARLHPGEDPSMWLAVHQPLPNVWLGVSVEDQRTADERIPEVLATPAAVRFVSYEPALGPVEWRPSWLAGYDYDARGGAKRSVPRLDWIIVGGESGPGARPFDVAWARSTITACRAAGVACFVKQLGALPVFDPSEKRFVGERANALEGDGRLRARKGGDPDEWPEDLRVREFPKP